MITFGGRTRSAWKRSESLELVQTTVKPLDLGHHLRRRIVPAAGTAGLLLLLLHKSSDSPVLFNRYSIDYATLLALAACNVALLWRKSLLRFSYRALFSYGLLVIFCTFLFDFFVMGLDLPFFAKGDTGWLKLVLLATAVLQLSAVCGERRLRKTITVNGELLARAAMVGCSVTFVVMLGELVLRLFLLETLSPKNEREFLRLMSRQWKEPTAVAKPSGTVRILGLSDSFGVMGSTSGNYHYILEAMLRQQVYPRIQMVNVSVSGYSPRDELAMLRFGMRYAPDIVLHGFFVGNDFTVSAGDDYEYRGIRIENETGKPRYWPRHFFLVDFIRNQWIRRRDLRQIEHEQKTGAVKEVGYLSRKFFLKMQFQRMVYLQRRSENEMKQVFPVLDSIQNVVQKGSARYVMIIHPDHTQVDDALKMEIIQAFQLNKEDYDFDFPQKLLSSYCVKSGILCVDLLPAFRAKAKKGALYTVSDGHYNLQGNRLAADSIREFIVERALVRKGLVGRDVSVPQL